MSTQNFKSVITKSGVRAQIAIPFDPNQVWGVRERHHVSGSVNGCKVRGPLDFDEGGYFLALGAAWRRDNGLEVGAEVAVALWPEGPQAESLSPDIADALESDPQAKAFFQSLATFYRRSYIQWIEGARRPEARKARIEELLRLLKAGKKAR